MEPQNIVKKKVFVCKKEKISSKRPFIFTLGKYEQLVIFKSVEKYFAVEDQCPHAGAFLHDADIDKQKITCIWHGWKFDLETGRCFDEPWAKLKTYSLEVTEEDIFLILEEQVKKGEK
jgi:nitrite reductase/ring-hydroxylating ferredoxin subunit